MSQNTYTVPNGSGSGFRGGVNAALQALASTNSGNSAPGTPFAQQQWIDTDTPSSTVWTWNVYDGADWIKIGEINSTTNTFDVSAGIGGARPRFSVHRNGTNQTSVAHNAFTKVQLTTEELDTNANFDSATNYRFTPTVAGDYMLEGSVQVNSMAASSTLVVAIYKNGSLYRSGPTFQGSGNIRASVVVGAVPANGSSDYFELFVFPFDGAATARDIDGASTFTRFAGHRIA